jgi:hypothetical protein
MAMEGARARRLVDPGRLAAEAPAGSEFMTSPKGNPMFRMIAAILVFLWRLGLVSSYTMEEDRFERDRGERGSNQPDGRSELPGNSGKRTCTQGLLGRTAKKKGNTVCVEK